MKFVNSVEATSLLILACLLFNGLSYISCEGVRISNTDGDEDKEEEPLPGPGTYHFLAVTHSLKSALMDQRKEISSMKQQIITLLKRLENGEGSIVILENNITARLVILETQKNATPIYKVDTLNIYEDGKCNVNASDNPDRNQTHTDILREQQLRIKLQDKVSELEISLRTMEKKVEFLEQKFSEVNPLDSVHLSFLGTKTLLAKSPYSNRMYIFPISEKLDFHSAKSYCEERNTTLASIHSKGEYNFVQDWLSTHFKVYSHFWLGHQRPNSGAPGSSDNGWHDGTTIDYTSWGPVDNGGRPNSFGCMFMCHHCGPTVIGWYIRPCHDKFNFLCQKVL